MRYVLKTLVVVSWALWLGGLVTLFITIQAVNREFIADRITFGRAGSAMFGVFIKYQIVIGAITCLCALGLLILENRRLTQVLFFVLALAMAGAIVSVPIASKIDSMRLARQTTTPEFKKAHGQSMMVFMSETLLLLAMGFAMPGILVSPAKKE